MYADKQKRMSNEIIEKLLLARIELSHMFDKKFKSRLKGWRAVQKMSGLYQFNIDQLRIKWDNLYKTYKKVCLDKETPEQYPVRKWQWFDVLHAFHNRQPIIFPQPETPDIAGTPINLSPSPPLVMSVSPNHDNQSFIHPAEICRICLSNLELEQQISIFADELYYMDRKIQIMDIFTSCIKVKIKKDKLLPQNICMDCLSELMACYVFTLKCIKAEESHKKSTKTTEIYIIENSFTQNKLDDIASVVKIEDPFHNSDIENDKLSNENEEEILETLMHDQYANELSLKTDIKEETNEIYIFENSFSQNNSDDLESDIEMEDPFHNSDLEDDKLNSKHEQEISKALIPDQSANKLSSKTDLEEETSEIYIFENSFSQNNSDDLASYIEIEDLFLNSGLENDKLNSKNEEEISKTLIPDQFANELSLKTVVKKKTENFDVFQLRDTCTDPQFAINNNQENENNLSENDEKESSLHQVDQKEKLKCRSHMQDRSNSPKPRKILQCREKKCIQNFITTINYRKHSTTHLCGKVFLCEFCGNSYKNKDSFSGHLRIHKPSDDRTCKLCNKTFQQKLAYQKHLRRHTNERPFKCDKCSATFRDNWTLKIHAAVHSNERPYKCSKCDKRYKLKRHMLFHYKKDHTDTTFKCFVCEKVFRCKLHLKNHQQTHFNERNLPCDKCDKLFKTRKCLRDHKQSHTKPHSCSVCNAAFSFNYILNAHMKKHKLVSDITNEEIND